MFDMGFDIYAFVNPKTKEDYSALLDEALREADNINQHLKKMEGFLESKRKPQEGGPKN